MSEKSREHVGGKSEKAKSETMEFDREAEKKRRQEIRKLIVSALSESLKKGGFKKEGYSLWSRKADDAWLLLYLQRSQWGHEYYIEAGICNEKDIPEGEKLDIVFCKTSERIEGMITDVEKERGQAEEGSEQKIREKVNSVNTALEFEVPGAQEKFPEEYFFPSVDIETAKQKVKRIQEAVEEYVHLWFELKRRV